MFRYWDGRVWSAAVSPDASAPPPPGSTAPGAGGPQAGPTSPGVEGETGRRGAGLWIGAGVAVVVLVLVVVFAVRSVGGESAGDGHGDPAPPPVEETCPVNNPVEETPVQHPADGRVHGGALSYPRLDQPWSSVHTEYRVPFGRDANVQAVTTEPNYEPGMNWQASVMVAELYAGDGFFAPEEASGIVVKCILGAFYGDNQVTRQDKVDEARALEGNDGWYLETTLSFDIPGLEATSEEVMIWIVQTSTLSSSLFYASIPTNSPPGVEDDARRVMGQLRVEK